MRTELSSHPSILQMTVMNPSRYQAAVQPHSHVPHPQCMGHSLMGRPLLAADVLKKSKFKALPGDSTE